MNYDYKIVTGFIPLPEEVKKLIAEEISETIRELGKNELLPKGTQFRLGYAAGCKETIERLYQSGKLNLK